MMKKLRILFSLLMLAMVSGAWATEATKTYTFTDKYWGATLDGEEANWTASVKTQCGFTSGQGVQITTSYSGATATSPESFNNVSKIVVTYCTNNKKGDGSINVTVGDGSKKENAISAPSTGGGTTLKTLELEYDTPETGNVVLEVTCSNNSLYVYSIAITYDEDGGDVTTPSISVKDVTVTGEESATLEVTTKNYTGDITFTSNPEGAATVTKNDDGTYSITATEDAVVTATLGDTGVSTTFNVTYKAPFAVEDGIFNFAEYDYGMTQDNNGYNANPTTLQAVNVTLSMAGNNNSRYFKNTDGSLELRPYKACTMTISVPEGNVITSITFEGSTTSEILYDGTAISDGKWTGSAASVDFTFSATQKVSKITVVYEKDTQANYYLVGDFNEWATSDDYKLTKGSDGKYTLTVSLAAAQAFKIFDSDNKIWYGAEADGLYWFTADNHTDVQLGSTDAHVNLYLDVAGDWTFVFDADAKTLTIDGWPEPVYYLRGSFDNWGDGVELTLGEDGKYIATQEVESGVEFKIVKKVGEAETWYGGEADDNNYWVTADNHTDIALSTTGKNFYIPVDGEFSFELDAEALTLTVTGWPVNIDGDAFVKVTATKDLTDGSYLIVYEDGNVAFDGSLETLDAANNNISVEIVEADGAKYIAATDETKAAIFEIKSIEGGYSVKSASGAYIGVSSYGNGLKTAEEPYTHAISIDEDGNAVMTISTTGGTMTLRYNSDSNQNRFRYFKSSQKPIALYKLNVEQETVEIVLKYDATSYYNAEKALDFTDTGLTPYIATQKKKGYTIIDEIGMKVPAGTPIVLKGEPNTYEVPVIADEEAEAVEGDNLLVGVSDTYDVTTEDVGYVYRFVYSKTTQATGFQKAKAGQTVSAGKAYLRLPEASSKEFFSFDEMSEATGVSTAVRAAAADGALYNLNGQRVDESYRGVVIQNGRKRISK